MNPINALQRPTLVLNRSWQPVNIASVARSFSMVYSGGARFVDPESYQLYDWTDWAALTPSSDEPFVRSVDQRFRVPEVIALAHYDRFPNSSVTFNRRNIFRRDRFMCQYCGKQPSPKELTIDHVLPRSKGGTSNWTNCVLACIGCNHRKANRLPKEASMRLLKTPVQPLWSPRFSRHQCPIDSWQKFVSESYWETELKV